MLNSQHTNKVPENQLAKNTHSLALHISKQYMMFLSALMVGKVFSKLAGTKVVLCILYVPGASESGVSTHETHSIKKFRDHVRHYMKCFRNLVLVKASNSDNKLDIHMNN